MKYRKKPVIIEAVQFNRKKADCNCAKEYPMITDLACFSKAPGIEKSKDRFLVIDPEDNTFVSVNDGDYIYRDDKNGKFYLCDPDVFEEIYEAVKR
ncbi:hypothetical protein ACG7HL_000846 [Enterococcus faecium]|uniref:hypothetical protein n=1 Tax=Enterococcus faecium TaxID=1352 RepID=UPI00280EDC2D|nr:hypothetical protein [Enterococcus faecium]MDU5304788.1 hypothetical protein [Enterococcus faecium]HAQ4410624.1 hypothetical protein [Enterococcus faecium]